MKMVGDDRGYIDGRWDRFIRMLEAPTTEETMRNIERGVSFLLLKTLTNKLVALWMERVGYIHGRSGGEKEGERC